MGETILILLLGWGLGFLSNLYWEKRKQKRIRENKKEEEEKKQKKEDRNIFVQIVEVLSDLIAPVESGKGKNTSHENFNELEKLYSMIQCEEDRDLADEIQTFIKENRGYDAVSYKALRGKIRSLKSKVMERIKKK